MMDLLVVFRYCSHPPTAFGDSLFHILCSVAFPASNFSHVERDRRNSLPQQEESVKKLPNSTVGIDELSVTMDADVELL